MLSNQLQRIAVQVALGTVGVALITALCFPAHLDMAIPSLLYLLIVVVQSLTAGFASAVVVSIVAVACLEYFFVPPILTWNVASPIDYVALATFLATSLVITRLASRARIDANSAESKRRDLAQLYELALRLLSLEPEVAAGGPVTQPRVASSRVTGTRDGPAPGVPTSGFPDASTMPTVPPRASTRAATAGKAPPWGLSSDLRVRAAMGV